MEKLTDIKAIIEVISGENKEAKIKLEDLKGAMEKVGMSQQQQSEFFQDFIMKNPKELITGDIQKHISKLEKSLLERFLGNDKVLREESEYNVTSNIIANPIQEEENFSY